MALAGFVADVELAELAPRFGEGAEIRRKGDARQVFGQVVAVALPIGGGMQQAVGVVEDVLFADAVVFVVQAESGAGLALQKDGRWLAESSPANPGRRLHGGDVARALCPN